MNPSGAGTLVVGVDGSPGARAALEYAVAEAVAREAPVLVVTAYEPTLIGVTATGGIPSAQDFTHRARETGRTEVEAVLASSPEGEQLDIAIEVASGPAPTVLTRLSREAAALVVGHRGRGSVASHLIGSVSLSCVVHAETTVVVVRRPPRDDVGG